MNEDCDALPKELLRKTQIQATLQTELLERGERVWSVGARIQDQFIKARSYFFSKPIVPTSQLIHDVGVLPSSPPDTASWYVSRPSANEWRLYLRSGEEYSESGVPVITSPIKVELKSRTDYLRFLALPSSLWWQATCSCPFCFAICTGKSYCKHLFIVGAVVQKNFRNNRLEKLLGLMSERKFNCGINNIVIDGLKIKTPRIGSSTEWFRFSYWYLSDSSIAARIEDVLQESFDVETGGLDFVSSFES